MKPIRKVSILLLLLFCFQAASANWTKQSAGTFAWLLDVYFVSENTGWIAGTNGTLLKTEDGGKNWKKQTGVTQDAIRQVYFSDESNGWLLCERSVFNRGSNALSYVLKTTDGGENWERMEIFEEERGRISHLFFDRKNNVYAVGETGAFFVLPDGENKWKKRVSPNKYLLIDGIFNGEANVVIVGAGGSIVFSEDGGATWNQSNVFGSSGAKGKFNSVFFINQKSGWTVGSEGRIFRTTSGGKTWREQKSGITTDLTDIFFINSGEGWAIGEEGVILYTATGGNRWSPAASKIRHRLEKVFFVGKKGWIVGFGGTILSYGDEKDNQQAKPKLQNRSR